jgi:hypothetical protein
MRAHQLKVKAKFLRLKMIEIGIFIQQLIKIEELIGNNFGKALLLHLSKS